MKSPYLFSFVSANWEQLDGGTKSCECYNNCLSRPGDNQGGLGKIKNDYSRVKMIKQDELEEGSVTREGRVDIIHIFYNWMDDRGERACCISLWWKFVIVTMKTKIPTFTEAFRTVTVTQISSTLMERVFLFYQKL